MRRSHALLALLVGLLRSVDALAQQTPDSSVPVEYPKWDVSATWGVGFSNNRDRKAFQDNGEGFAVWNVDVGRYLTTHVKVDAGLMLARSQSGESRRFPIDGLPDDVTFFFSEYAFTTVRPTTVAGSVTYQFRDNQFTHPYVAAGVRTIWQARHTVRDEGSIRFRGVTYRIPGVDERSTSFSARPFFAFGCKSYFNRTVFMRSEALVALGPSGYSHTTLRLGTGVDF